MGVDPLTLVAGSAVLGTAGQLYGAREQEKAIGRAAGSEAEYRQMLLEEYAPFREAAREILPLVQEEAMREPGTGQLFQRGLSRGIEEIRRNLRQAGLTDSSVAGRAIGELTSDLTAADIQRISGLRQGLLGGAGTGFQQLAGSYGRSQELGLAQGAVKGASYGAIGDIFSQLPLVYGLLKKPKTNTDQYVFDPTVNTTLKSSFD